MRRPLKRAIKAAIDMQAPLTSTWEREFLPDHEHPRSTAMWRECFGHDEDK